MNGVNKSPVWQSLNRPFEITARGEIMSKKSRASPTSWLRIIVTGGTFIKRPWGKARTVPYRRTRDFSSFLRASGLPTVGRRRGKIFILQPRYRYLKYTGVCSRPRHSYEILDKRSAAWEGIGWAVPGLDTTKLWLQRWFSPGLNGAINTSFSIAEDENTRVPSCTILRTVGLDFASRLLRRLGSSPTATSKFANDYLFRETTSHMRRISQLFIMTCDRNTKTADVTAISTLPSNYHQSLQILSL